MIAAWLGKQDNEQVRHTEGKPKEAVKTGARQMGSRTSERPDALGSQGAQMYGFRIEGRARYGLQQSEKSVRSWFG